MALQFLTKESLARVDESTGQGSVDGTQTALLNLPYDIGFLAGFDINYVPNRGPNGAFASVGSLRAGPYGQMVMARSGTFVGIIGYLDHPPLGNTIIDIEKNGTSIFSTKPQFTQTNNLSTGVLSTTTFSSGNRITFKVTTLGSVAGSGMRVTLKCKV